MFSSGPVHPICEATPNASEAGGQTADSVAAADEGEVIVVTGFRGALNAALNVKRESVSSVDAIVAEDGDIRVDRVFIGSCTNSRLEDLLEASLVVKGRRVSPKVRAMVVPGSQQVKAAAERLGLDRVFKEAGFEWRESGCSMCLGMNPDILAPGERCASTSNRNFEGRQGVGGRTHLVSPIMAAAAAIEGHFVDIREWL